MALTFPILSLNPSSFSMEPVNKSLIPENVSSLYASGRELYIGNPYIIDIKYTNLNATDTAKLITFCDLVGTLLPFRFMFEQYVYSASFMQQYQISKQDYGLSNVTLKMRTFAASLNNWPNLETNLAKKWYYLDDYPYAILNIFNSLVARSVYDTINTSFSVNNVDIPINYTPPQPAAYIYCSAIDDGGIQLQIGTVYTLTTKLILFYGQIPTIGIWTGSVFEFPVKALDPGYQTTEFTAVAVPNIITVGNTQTSEWSLEIELIEKVV